MTLALVPALNLSLHNVGIDLEQGTKQAYPWMNSGISLDKCRPIPGGMQTYPWRNADISLVKWVPIQVKMTF